MNKVCNSVTYAPPHIVMASITRANCACSANLAADAHAMSFTTLLGFCVAMHNFVVDCSDKLAIGAGRGLLERLAEPTLCNALALVSHGGGVSARFAMHLQGF